MEPYDHALCAFRRSLYECLHRRGDALFELTDTILAADTPPSLLLFIGASKHPTVVAEAAFTLLWIGGE